MEHLSAAASAHGSAAAPVAPAGTSASAAALPRHQGQEAAGRPNTFSDEFMMYTFKVEMCKRTDKHDREKCPYAHPGEIARRRHPSLYQALPCPEARAKKICPRLERCNCSHSTFEFWLHPDRYKTFLCERGAGCDRPICFFAHSEGELRELPSGLQRTRGAQRPAAPTDTHPMGQGPAHEQGAEGRDPQQQLGHYAGAAAGPSSLGGHHHQHQHQHQHAPLHPGAVMGYGPMVPPGADMPAGAAGLQPGPAGPPARPAAGQQRGRTVAVIPAGPSTWQGNAAIEADPGEAPSLEALCAAVARASMAATDQQQQQPLHPGGGVLQQQQLVPLPGQQQGVQVAMLPHGGMHYPMLQMLDAGHPPMQLVLTSLQPPHHPEQHQQQQHQQQQQQQQQADLPGGGAVFMPLPAHGQGGAPPGTLPWGMAPGG